MDNNNSQRPDMAEEISQDISEKKRRNRTILIICIIIAALVLVGIIVFGILRDSEEPEAPAAAQPTKEIVVYGDEYYGIDPEVDKALQDYRNVVLFGIDTKTIERQEGHRSDGIIILSFNKKTDDVKIFSIYRDTYLKIDDQNYDKINHAYAFGGMDQSIKALNRNLDLNIREGMALTWESIANLVDNIGGVEINILDSEISTLNSSLSDADKIASTGRQKLNGTQAVAYSRMRYDSARGDFRRNERMQDVLIAALNKAQTKGTAELISIMDETLDDVVTNMSTNTMTETLMEIADYTITDNVCWPYETKGWMKNSIYYGVPVSLKSNVVKLHKEFFDQVAYDPTENLKKISRHIGEESGYYSSDDE